MSLFSRVDSRLIEAEVTREIASMKVQGGMKSLYQKIGNRSNFKLLSTKMIIIGRLLLSLLSKIDSRLIATAHIANAERHPKAASGYRRPKVPITRNYRLTR